MPHKRTREHVGRGRPRRLHVNKPLFFFFFGIAELGGLL